MQYIIDYWMHIIPFLSSVGVLFWSWYAWPPQLPADIADHVVFAYSMSSWPYMRVDRFRLFWSHFNAERIAAGYAPFDYADAIRYVRRINTGRRAHSEQLRRYDNVLNEIWVQQYNCEPISTKDLIWIPYANPIENLIEMHLEDQRQATEEIKTET